MRFPALVQLALLLLPLGCSNEPSTNLLSVQNFAPRHVDAGDRVELVGAGFPEGKTATVTFRGELRRPGSRPTRDARIVASATASSPDRVSIAVDAKLQSEFCGEGAEAQHTTFQGDVIVAFAPRRAGAPPVTGVLHDVSIDVEAPAPSQRVAQERDAETRRAHEFLGLKLAPDEASDRLRIESIRRGSPAERAGLLAGDTILSVDGVGVFSPGDVIPARGQRLSEIVIRRGRLAKPLQQRVEVAGFHSAAPTELIPAAVALAVPAALALIVHSRVGMAIGFLSRLLGTRLRARRVRAERRFRATALLEEQAALPLSRALPYLVFLAVSAAFTVIAFGQHLVSPDLDLGLICLGAITSLLVVSLVSGGFREPGRFSLRAGLGAAFSVLAHQLPALLVVMSTVLVSGSLRLRDAVSAQGAWPWQWRAFESPTALLGFVLLIVVLVPSAARSAPAWLKDVVALAEWGNLLLLSGVAGCLFLGGWNLPFGAGDGAGPSARAAGAALLQLKCWAVIGGVLGLRWLLPRVEARWTASWCWRRAVPLALASVALTLLWGHLGRTTLVRELEQEARWVVFGTAFGLLALFGVRLRAALRGQTAVVAVNPWL